MRGLDASSSVRGAARGFVQGGHTRVCGRAGAGSAGRRLLGSRTARGERAWPGRNGALVKCKTLSSGRKKPLITVPEVTLENLLSLCKKWHYDGDLVHLSDSIPDMLRLQLLQPV